MKEKHYIGYQFYLDLDNLFFLEDLSKEWATSMSDVLRTILTIYRKKREDMNEKD